MSGEPVRAEGGGGGLRLLGLLLRVNGQQGWRRFRAIRDQSRLLSLLIGVFLAGYALLAFWLFRRGLEFVGAFPGLGDLLVERLVFLLFAFLFVLLLFSNLVISYTNLFRNRETNFLLSLPVPPQTIFRWKFIESSLLASWAFLFLVAPLLVAFGLSQQVPWHFYGATILLIALFIVLPAALGSWAALGLARYLDRRVFQICTVAGIGVLLLAATTWLRTETVTEEMLETRVLVVLDRLLVKTRFAQFPFLPSYWLSSGVLHWSEGAVSTAVFFGLVLLSNTLLLGCLAFTRTGALFYESISAVHSRGSVFWKWGWFQRWQLRRLEFAYGRGGVERVVAWCGWLRSDVRALLVKDVRVFWRDTAQWGQTLVLFGLLAAYIVNLRQFSQQLTNPFWVQLVSYLNLGACSLNLATLTTRFVYPQFSLEGKRVWIIGLAPLGMASVVRTKYWLASLTSLAITLAMVVLSCVMLRLPTERMLFYAGAIVVMTLTLNGLAVGLGVLYPNFKEDNPGKIVSGFGGTLCLVLSFLYILCSVFLLAVGSPWPWPRTRPLDPAVRVTCWSLFLGVSIGLGWVPLRLGLRRLSRIEL